MTSSEFITSGRAALLFFTILKVKTAFLPAKKHSAFEKDSVGSRGKMALELSHNLYDPAVFRESSRSSRISSQKLIHERVEALRNEIKDKDEAIGHQDRTRSYSVPVEVVMVHRRPSVVSLPERHELAMPPVVVPGIRIHDEPLFQKILKQSTMESMVGFFQVRMEEREET